MKKQSSGIGLLGVLQIVFIVLKLTDNIDWSWWWVFAPALLSLYAFALLMLGIVVLTLAAGGRK